MTADKYQYAFDEAKALGDLAADYRAREKESVNDAGSRDPSVPDAPFDIEVKTSIMVRYNTFIDYMLDSFDNTDVKAELIRDYLNGGFKVDNFEDLRTMGEGFLPVVIMRNLIAVHRVPAETTKMPAFDRFAMVYKDRIAAK
jgi:hypothetical protein